MDNRYVLSVSSHGEVVKGIMKLDYSDEASKLIVEMIIRDFNCNFLLSGKVTISILDLQAKDSSIQSVPLLSLNVQKSTIISIDAESTGSIYVVLDLDVLADEVTEGNTEWKPAPEDVISAPFVSDANEVEWQTGEPQKDVEIATPLLKKGDIVVYWDSKNKSNKRRWGIMTGFNTGICEIKRIGENGIIDYVLVNSIAQINPTVDKDFKIGDKIAYRKEGQDLYSYVDVIRDIGKDARVIYVNEKDGDYTGKVNPERVIKILDRAATEPEAPVVDGKPVKGDKILYLVKDIKHEGEVIGVYKDNVYVVKILSKEYSGTHTISLDKILRVIH